MMNVKLVCLLVLSMSIHECVLSQSKDEYKQIYISSNATTSCGLGLTPCYTLTGLALNKQLLSMYQKIEVHFLDGIHVLNVHGLNALIFENVSQVYLIGMWNKGRSRPPSIECISDTGFVFQNVDDVRVSNLRFVSCQGLYRLNCGANVTSALLFNTLNYLKIQNVTVQNSSDIGLYAVNILHDISVRRSSFLANFGGDVMLVRNYSTCLIPSAIFNVVIEDSVMAYSGHTSTSSVGGLKIDLGLSCGSGIICLRNITMSSNSAQLGGGFGVHFGPDLREPVNVTINNCLFENGSAYRGGGIYLSSYNANKCDDFRFHYFSVVNSSFRSNTALSAGGAIYMDLSSQCNEVFVELSHVSVTSNTVLLNPDHQILSNSTDAIGTGGGLFIRIPTSSQSRFVYERLLVETNEAYFGGGLYLFYDKNNLINGLSCLNQHLIVDQVLDSIFTNNHATYGGASYIEADLVTRSSYHARQLSFSDLTFTANTAAHVASAMFITKHSENISFTFNRLLFSRNYMRFLAVFDRPYLSETLITRDSISPAAFVLSNVDVIYLTNCSFIDNSVGGLAAFQSDIKVEGIFRFLNNTSINGGGLALYSSQIHLQSSTIEIIFAGNVAQRMGGAIFVYEEPFMLVYSSTKKNCFLEVDVFEQASLDDQVTDCSFTNNVAIAGSVLYGGNLDFCKHARRFFDSKCMGGNNTKEPSAISSEAVQLCFCESMESVCSVRKVNVSILPGESFSFSVIAFGQRNGTTPAIVRTDFNEKSEPMYQYLNGGIQSLSSGCNNVTFTASSSQSFKELTLSAESIISQSGSLKVSVNFLPCPGGFSVLPPSPNCQCISAFRGITSLTCNDRDLTVERRKDVWVDYHCSNPSNETSDCGFRYHSPCPYKFCDESSIQVDLNLPNSICTGNRVGILCGSCKPNYSMILGGSECWDCRDTNRNLALITVFALAGVVLIIFVTSLNLTVSSGTINGLILYAAVVQLNHNAFFPTGDINVLTVFLSWLNLDFGIKTCFYEGMDTVGKVGLQLVFPFYVIVLLFIVFVAVTYSFRLTKLLSSRYVLSSILTIFLLAYMKLFRTAVTVLPFASITSQLNSQTETIWLSDGDTAYFNPGHLVLFVVSVIILLVLSFPYTCFLLLANFVFRLSFIRCLKLRLTLDAYSGNSKMNSRFWIGLLLLSYSAEVVVYHITKGEIVFNLVFAILCACFLLSISLVVKGVYNKTFINRLEWFFLLNIIVMSVLVILLKENVDRLVVCVYVFISTAFIAFFGIVILHCYQEFRIFKYIHRVISTRQWSQLLIRTIRYNPLPQSDEECGYQSVQQEMVPMPARLRDNSPARDLVDLTSSTFDSNPNDYEPTNYPTPYFREHPELLQSGARNDTTSHSDESPRNKSVNQTKNVTSSVLFVRPNEEEGLADLVTGGAMKQSIEKDEQGVSTLVIEHQKTSTDKLNIVQYLTKLDNISADSSQAKAVDTAVASSNTPIAPKMPRTPSYSKIHRRVRRNAVSYRSLPRKCQSIRKQTNPKLVKFNRTLYNNIEELNTTATVLSTCVPSSLLVAPVSVVKVTNTGTSYTNIKYGVSLKVPPGAVSGDNTAHFEIGILIHGPFKLTPMFTRVSPVLWVCCRDLIQFEKEIEITLPHCLKSIGNEDLGLCFMKTDDCVSSTSNEKMFLPLEHGTQSRLYPSKGTLETKEHCCFFCIAAKKSSHLFLKKAEYCLTRIDPKPWCPDTTVYFCLSYFLKACFEVIEQQFPKDRFEIKNRTCFQFLPAKINSESEVTIEVSSASTPHWHLVVEHPGKKQIPAAEIDFWHEDEQTLHLKQEYGMYPPRFCLRIFGVNAYRPSSALVSFRGIVPNIDCTLLLRPASSIIAPHRSESCGTFRKTCSCSYNGSSHQLLFSSITQELREDFEGVLYQPEWGDLDLDIVCNVAAKWQEVGILLGVRPEKLDQIRINHQHSGVQNMLRDVLREWSKNDWPPFQWAYILRVLQAETVRENNLALRLIKKYSKTIFYS